MKLFYIKWTSSIRQKHFVVFNCDTAAQRDKLFDQWCKDNPDDSPLAYSPREINIKKGTCVHLNSIS